jgi:iron complex outermembrane receptor protein
MKSLYRLFCFCVSVVVAVSSASAQTGILKGAVLDASTKEAVTGANIFLLAERSSGTSSDENGNFSLTLPEGNQTLICSYIGYTADTFTVVIEPAKTTEYNVLLHFEATELNQVVVSVGKYEQRIEEVSVSMEILKPKLIEAKNTTTITQALEQVPGLNILDEEPQIRGGSGFAFGVGSRAATLINGIPILRGDIGKPDWDFIPIENLNQVEVIKGAASVMYGSSALSGVINFFTSYPTEPSETKVRLYSGFYSAPKNPAANWWNGAANYSGLNISQGWKNERYDLIIGGQLRYDHGYIGPPVPDPRLGFEQDTLDNSEVSDRSGRVNFDFRYRPKNMDRLSFGMNGNLMRQQSNFSLVWGDDSAKIYRAFPGTITLTNNTQLYLDPFLSYLTTAGLQHSLKGRYYLHRSELPDVQTNFSTVYYAEYQLAKEFSKIENLRASAGAVLNNSFVQDDYYTGGGGLQNTLENYAVYLQVDKKFYNALNLSAGLRGEYFAINNTESTVQPIFRFGANLQLAQASFLRFSYGQGFRYPTIAEKFILTTVGGLTVFPNPELEPETSWNSEIGFKQLLKFGSWYGFADFAFFWQEYTNTIEYNYALWAPDSAGFRFVNTGHTRVRGWEVAVNGEGKIAHNLTLSLLGGYTFTLPQSVEPEYVYAVEDPGEGFIPKELSYLSTSTDTTDFILKYRMQHIAKMDAELTRKPWAVGFSIRYYSFMQNIDKTFYDIDLSGTLPTGIVDYRAEHHHGTWVTDARISFDFFKHYTAALVVSNLFNLEYSLRPVKIEPMRTMALQVRALL